MKKVSILLLIILSLSVSNVFAYSIVEDNNSVILRIDDNGDRYYLLWSTGTSVTKMIAKKYNDSSFTDLVSTTEHIAGVNNSYSYWAGIGQLYDTYWTYDLYDRNNNLIGHVKFDSHKETPETPPDLEPISKELVIVMKDIKSILTSQSNVFTDIKHSLSHIDLGIKNLGTSINNLHNEFKTNNNYVIDRPDTSKIVEQNKPYVPDMSFKDDNVYFQDNGDVAETPGRLPVVPEPTDNWDGIMKENELEKEKEQQLSEQLEKDTEKTLDEFEKSEELLKDDFTKEEELVKDEFEKDSEMVTDEFNKESEMVIDSFEKSDELDIDSFNKSPELIREDFKKDVEMNKDIFEKDDFTETEKYNRNHFYNKTNIFDQTNIMGVTQ